MGFFKRDRPHSEIVQETVAAADVKARAEVLLEQMTANLTELKSLILGKEGDERNRSNETPDG